MSSLFFLVFQQQQQQPQKIEKIIIQWWWKIHIKYWKNKLPTNINIYHQSTKYDDDEEKTTTIEQLFDNFIFIINEYSTIKTTNS